MGAKILIFRVVVCFLGNLGVYINYY
jgi:hypothetical protein